MNRKYAVGASAAVVLLVSSVIAADALKSGLQEGDKGVPAFNPKHATGPGAGGSACLV